MTEASTGFGRPRCHRCTRPSSASHDFARLASWCPDGSCILTQSDDGSLRIYDVPEANDAASEDWSCRLNTASAGPVTSTCWYPGARADDPATMCFAKATRDHPVHLVDASTGRTRASYPIIDHCERVVGPHSMVFSTDGSTLYCGYESAIEIFAVGQPGAEGERLRTRPTRKSKDGQKGIISTLAVDPSQSGLLAAGSFSGSVGIYDTRTSRIDPVVVFPAGSTGITQVRFHPSRPLLFSAARRSDVVTCWDVRQAASILQTFDRPGDTNQRIAFDIDPWGRWLTTGDTDGNVRVYDIQTCDSAPFACWKLHGDVVSSAAFHPWKPILMTCAGSRKLDELSLARSLQGRSPFDASDSENEAMSKESTSPAAAYSPDPARVGEAQLALWTFNFDGPKVAH